MSAFISVTQLELVLEADRKNDGIELRDVIKIFNLFRQNRQADSKLTVSVNRLTIHASLLFEEALENLK